MIWGETTKQKLERKSWVYGLHAWFAWYPVKLDNGRWIWLQWIWQQKNRTVVDGVNVHQGRKWSRETLCEACALRFSCDRGYRSKTTALHLCSFTKKDEPKEANGKNGT